MSASKIPGSPSEVTLKTGSSVSVGGNIDAYGSILIGGGSVSGQVTHPAGTTYSGPRPGGGNVTGSPNIPVVPAFPANVTFQALGGQDIMYGMSLMPGTYGNIKLGGRQTLVFSEPGTYIFQSVTNSGSANDFVFDFNTMPTGNFRIYIEGDAQLGKISASFKNGGGADRIFTEVHGNGSARGGVAFNIDNGSSGKASKWLGMVWVPDGDISIGSGTGSSDLTGALICGKGINIQSGVTIKFATLVDDQVIFPYYPPPTSGKVNDLVGSELTSLYYNAGNVSDITQNIFIISGSTVMIEVIAKAGKVSQLLSLLRTAPYGLTDLIDNGPNSLIITGRYPIANLLNLLQLEDLIEYCRPLFPPVGAGATGLTVYQRRHCREGQLFKKWL